MEVIETLDCTVHCTDLLEKGTSFQLFTVKQVGIPLMKLTSFFILRNTGNERTHTELPWKEGGCLQLC